MTPPAAKATAQAPAATSSEPTVSTAREGQPLVLLDRLGTSSLHPSSLAITVSLRRFPMTDALTLMQATPFAVVFVLAVVCVAIAIGALFD